MKNSDENWREQWEKSLEKFYSGFSTHANVFDYNAQIVEQTSHTQQYAHLALKSIFFINGGALLAIPPVVATFDLSAKDAVLEGALCFSLGLVLTTFAILFAFFSSAKATHCLRAEKYKNFTHFYILNMQSHLDGTAIKEQERLHSEYGKNEKDFRKEAIDWELAAIIYGIASILSFIAGTIFLLFGFSS